MASGHSEADVAEAKRWRNGRYQDLIRSSAIDIPGVVDVLTELRKTHTLAIVTTAKQCDFELIHAQRNIAEHFALILTNQDYARSKPAPDPYLAALQHFGVAAENALVVEDSERGLNSAVNAGIDCATVYHPFTEPQNFAAATYRISQLSELLDLVSE